MSINTNLKNNLNLLLKSKGASNSNKNKKFVQSFFNIKTNLGYQNATANSFLEPEGKKDIKFLQKKKFKQLNKKEIKEALKEKKKIIIIIKRIH